MAKLLKLLAQGDVQPVITHASLVATLTSAAKFLADGMVHPFTRATHPTLTLAVESKLSALASLQP